MHTNENLTFNSHPLVTFAEWFTLAKQHEVNDPNAMSLATVASGGRPSVRIVLLKAHDESGFRFYTHATSRKGQEIRDNPNVALCFHWKSLQRQVRIEGTAQLLDEKAADDYFAGRMRMSQIGAWASQQSAPLQDRETFLAALHEFEAKFENQPVPRPPQWRGYHVTPTSFEFWAERPFRLHDRMLYRRTQDSWEQELLYP